MDEIGVINGDGRHESPAAEVEVAFTEADRQEYAGIKDEIKTNRVRDGGMLSRVRDKGFYRIDGYATFEGYVTAEWGISRRRAYQLIDSFKVQSNVNPGTQTPRHEKQTRPLVSLAPEQQAEAWDRAVEEAGGGQPTTRQVKEAADVVKRELKDAPEITLERKARPAAPEEHDAVDDEVGGEGGGDDEAGVDDDAPEDDLDDDAWLARFGVREKLTGQCRAFFDCEALVFREIEGPVRELAEKIRPSVRRLKDARHHIGTLQTRVYHFLKTEDPRFWEPCPDCAGDDGLSSGRVPAVGKCPLCRGEGFLIP